MILNILLNILLVIALIYILNIFGFEVYCNRKLWFIFIVPILLGTWIATRFGLKLFMSIVISSVVSLSVLFFEIRESNESEKRHEIRKKENNAKGERFLKYVKDNYPQYDFEGSEAKIFFSNYNLYSPDCKTIIKHNLEGRISIGNECIGIRFYHPYTDFKCTKDYLEIFIRRVIIGSRGPKIGLDSGKIYIDGLFEAPEPPIPRNALEEHIFRTALEEHILRTAKCLEGMDEKIVRVIYNLPHYRYD